MEITILGAGSWGVALAELLTANNVSVSVWHYKQSFISEINKSRLHPSLDFKVSEKINFISNSAEISKGSTILICLPSQAIRKTLSSLLLKNHYYIIASKGLELKSGKLISEIVKETTCATDHTIACLSGPSHAEELIRKIPTIVAVSSKKTNFSTSIQSVFSNKFFRVYKSDSIEAMQIGGAVKNIISIASGISEGLGYGDNTIAALITRGIQEIIRFCKVYTENTQSLLGISGIGDLIVTATSNHSRNKALGKSIGKGITLNVALEDSSMIAEGVETAKSVYFISRENNISMPICDAVYNILFNDKDPKLAIDELMSRELRSE